MSCSKDPVLGRFYRYLFEHLTEEPPVYIEDDVAQAAVLSAVSVRRWVAALLADCSRMSPAFRLYFQEEFRNARGANMLRSEMRTQIRRMPGLGSN